MAWRIFNVTDDRYIEANAIFGPWRDSWDTPEEAAFEMGRLENTMQAFGIDKELMLRCSDRPPPTRKDRRMSDLELIASLQRELAEARAHAREARQALTSIRAAVDADLGLERASNEAPVEVNTELYRTKILEAIAALKSRAPLTPLTDPSVRGVLVACADDDQHLSIVVDDVTGRKCVGKLRPASEFAVPDEPAQKLVPLPEKVHAWEETGEVRLPREGEFFREGSAVVLAKWNYTTDSYPICRKLDPALYGVPAGAEIKLAPSVDEAFRSINRALGFFRSGDRTDCYGMNEREISIAATEGVALLRGAIGTEQSMHSAWRKRATESESEAERLRERVRELEAENARLTKDNAAWDEACGLASEAASACRAEAERLRKAIEEGHHNACVDRNATEKDMAGALAVVRMVLATALTQPTAASGGDSRTDLNLVGQLNDPKLTTAEWGKPCSPWQYTGPEAAAPPTAASGEKASEVPVLDGDGKCIGTAQLRRVDGGVTAEVTISSDMAKTVGLSPPSAPAAESEGACPCDSEHDCARSIGLVVAGECIVQAKPSAFESFEKELPENLQKLNPTRAALDEANAKMRQAVAEREAQDVKRKAERDAARAAGADR